jgi:putative tryptophan/tyrosine transport system substrate-binding protein
VRDRLVGRITASTDAEIDTAFAAAVEAHADGLLVSDWPFFTVRHDRIAELALRHRLPTIYGWREYVAAGGLISYGSRLTDAWHQVGVYVGRILKGEKPADLPVVQPTKFEMVINLRAAKALVHRAASRHDRDRTLSNRRPWWSRRAM